MKHGIPSGKFTLGLPNANRDPGLNCPSDLRHHSFTYSINLPETTFSVLGVAQSTGYSAVNKPDFLSACMKQSLEAYYAILTILQ